MRKLGSRFVVAAASTLVALTAWCHVANGDQVGPGQGAWIGVTVRPLSDDWREQWAYRGSGVLVTGVAPNGPADKAGIAPGDVLVAAGSVSLWVEDDLALAKSRIDPGQSVPVVVARDKGHLIKIMNLETAPQHVADEDVPVPGDGEQPSATTPSVPRTPDLQPAPKPDAVGDRWTEFGTLCADLNADLAAALSVPMSQGV